MDVLDDDSVDAIVDAVAVAPPMSMIQMEEAATAWNRSIFAALEPKARGVYPNVLEDEGEARIRVVYPGQTYNRLAQIKRRYEPANVFHRNQNIRPA